MRHTFRYVAPEPPEAGSELTLSAADSHHLVRVVRRRPGDPVELIDRAGHLWPAVVVEVGERATVRVADARPGPAPADVVLYQGLAEWGRIDLVVEKAAELGVREVTLFTSSRARRIPDPDAWRRRRERLDRVAQAAARQSGQAWLPRVRGLVPFGDVVAEIPDGEGYLIDPRGEASLAALVGAADARGRGTALVVGPDAGFSEDEVAAARAAGLAVCGLGPTTLRAETAAIVAMGVALGASGRFGGGA
jgi:16S rRNA (uracil1498-N3)-methyltransferase